MTRAVSKWQLAAVLVAVAAIITACGSASGSSLEGAADATTADTSRFEMHLRVTGASVKSNFSMTAEGVFDYPNERGLMTVGGELPYMGEDVAFKEFRLIGKVGYTRWEVKGKTHWELDEHDETSGDPVELLVPFPGSPTKPTDVLTRVLLASDEEEELGEEEIRGTETTHYRARIDLEKLVMQLPEEDRPEGDVEDLWGQRFVPVEIWIDGESRLRRIKIEQSNENNETMSTVVELFDYGVEVDVQPPPADQIVSEEESNRLTGSTGIVTEERGETAAEEACKYAREELSKKDADEICSEVERQE